MILEKREKDLVRKVRGENPEPRKGDPLEDGRRGRTGKVENQDLDVRNQPQATTYELRRIGFVQWKRNREVLDPLPDCRVLARERYKGLQGLGIFKTSASLDGWSTIR